MKSGELQIFRALAVRNNGPEERRTKSAEVEPTIGRGLVMAIGVGGPSLQTRWAR